MTQSDKDPFWQTPKDYSKLPDFNEHFERLIDHKQKTNLSNYNLRPYNVKGNTDQTKLRDFLKNLNDEDDAPGYYDYDVLYEEWCQVYESLKDIITEDDTVKKLLDVTEEMDRWRAKYPSYAHRYWEKNYGKNK